MERGARPPSAVTPAAPAGTSHSRLWLAFGICLDEQDSEILYRCQPTISFFFLGGGHIGEHEAVASGLSVERYEEQRKRAFPHTSRGRQNHWDKHVLWRVLEGLARH